VQHTQLRRRGQVPMRLARRGPAASAPAPGSGGRSLQDPDAGRRRRTGGGVCGRPARLRPARPRLRRALVGALRPAGEGARAAPRTRRRWAAAPLCPLPAHPLRRHPGGHWRGPRPEGRGLRRGEAGRGHLRHRPDPVRHAPAPGWAGATPTASCAGTAKASLCSTSGRRRGAARSTSAGSRSAARRCSASRSSTAPPAQPRSRANRHRKARRPARRLRRPRSARLLPNAAPRLSVNASQPEPPPGARPRKREEPHESYIKDHRPAASRR
jgi:hypothetical protein